MRFKTHLRPHPQTYPFLPEAFYNVHKMTEKKIYSQKKFNKINYFMMVKGLRVKRRIAAVTFHTQKIK